MLLVIRDTMRHNNIEAPFADGCGGSLVAELVNQYGTDKAVTFYCVAPYETKFTKSVREKYRKQLYAFIDELKPDKIMAMGVGVHDLLSDDASRTTTDARGMLYEFEYTGGKALCITTVGINNLEMRDKRSKSWIINPSYFRDLTFDFVKLDAATGMPTPAQINRKVISSLVELEDELAYLANASAVALDIETSNVGMRDGKSPNPYQDEIYAVGFGALLNKDPYISYNIQVPVELCRDAHARVIMKRFLKHYHGKVILHNAMFDVSFLIKFLGFDFLNVDIVDTMLLAYSLDERPITERMGSLSLKYLSKLYFNTPDFSFSWEDFYSLPDTEKNWHDLYFYLGIDTHSTVALYYELLKELKDEPDIAPLLDNLLYPATVRLAHVILNGMPVDREFLADKIEQYKQRIQNILVELNTLEDLDQSQVSFNPNTPKDIVRVVEEVYGVTIPSSGESVLEDLKYNYAGQELSEFAKLLLEYRSASKLLGTYLEPLYRDSEFDGHIHGSFLLHGTSTGRLSSREPNLQNMPKTDDYVVRQAFVAPQGYKFVEVDYSQLELRVMAILSEDEHLKQAYVHGEDLHTKTASAIFGKSEQAVTKEERSLAKIFNFGIIYGRTGTGIANGKEMQELRRQGKPTMTVREAYDAIDSYFEKYPGIKDYMDRMEKQALKKHYVTSLFGRKRRFPLVTPDQIWKIRNQAANMPDQSTAGDFTLWSIVELFDKLYEKYGDKCKIINTVHDSILFTIHESILDEALQVITDTMVSVPIDTKGVPIEVDVDLGDNWGELYEYQDYKTLHVS